MERSDFERSQARELARLLTLLESERRYYQEIVASLPVGLLIVSGEGDPVSVNRAFRQMFALRVDDWKRRHLEDLLPVPGLREAVETVLRTATPRHNFLALVAVEKVVQPFRLAILPIRNWDNDLELEAVIVVEPIHAGENIPITQEVAAVADAPAPSVRPPAVIWTADPQTLRFLSVSGASDQILGYPPEHWTENEGFFEARIPVEDRPAAMEGVRGAIARGARYSFEYRSVAADGSTGWYRDTFHLDEGVLAGITTDITTRRLLEDQLLRAHRTEALQQAASRLSHDLNNPLMIITGYGEEVVAHFDKDDPIRNDLQQIMDATSRISRISGQLVQFARPAAQPASKVNVAALVIDLEEQLSGAAGDAVVTVSVPAEPVWGLADAAQLREVILTLSSGERADAMERTSLKVDIRVETLDEDIGETRRNLGPGRYAAIVFEDNGRGPDPAARVSNFEGFLAGKDPLGPQLARAYALVRSWGGDILYEAEANRGTRTRVWLKSTEPVAPSAVPEAVPEAVEAKPEPEPETILVVEDEAGIRALVRKILKRQGYRVLEAGGGAEALELARFHEGRIDLLLTDVMMPGMSGLELAHLLKDARPGVRVLYVSGYTDDAQISAGQFPPGSDFLQKPFTLGSLVNKVKEVLTAPAE